MPRRIPPIDNPICYMLAEDGETPIACTMEQLARWVANHGGDIDARRVERTYLNKGELCKEGEGDCEVSTVFLGVDHAMGSPGMPVLWETMIFGIWPGDSPNYLVRYSSLASAKKGHRRAVWVARGSDVNLQKDMLA